MEAEVWVKQTTVDTQVLVRMPRYMPRVLKTFENLGRFDLAVVFAQGVVEGLRAAGYKVEDPTL